MNKELVSFIIDARRKGYSDAEIRTWLREYAWPEYLVEEAFLDITKQAQTLPSKVVSGKKIKTFVYLDKAVITSLEKRAKKNLFSLSEQIEDILRRSVVGQKKNGAVMDHVDEKFIGIFSRRKKGKPRREY